MQLKSVGSKNGTNSGTNGRPRIDVWLRQKLNEQSIPGLKWIDQNSGILSITHRRGYCKNYNLEVDGRLYIVCTVELKC